MEEKDLKSKLESCVLRQEIEDVFSGFSIFDTQEKETILDNIMGNPETFYSKILEPEMQYQRKVSIFLTGAWKINVLYERAGL